MCSSRSQELIQLAKARKSYSLGSDVDKELVFDFSFLSNIDTVSYIQKYGKVMFLIRGPPSTGKAALSEMFVEKYPTAVHCCADHYFKNSFVSPDRNRESLKASHDYCEKKAKDACVSNAQTVIIQNTHMRKWEMQYYIDLAAKYNYTIIMAITLYRFDVTPEALLANNTDGLNIQYFRRRMRQWEDLTPVLTGWFIGPGDSAHLQVTALKTVQELIGDGKFCRLFNIDSKDEFVQYYRARRVLCGLAGYTADSRKMKKYYLSRIVQYLYGKSFTLSILGYHVTPTAINAIVRVDDVMQLLMLDEENEDSLDRLMHSLQIGDNMNHYNETQPYSDYKEPDSSTLSFEAWQEGEGMSATKYSFINIACKKGHPFNAGNEKGKFNKAIKVVVDSEGCVGDDLFTELEEGVKIHRVLENEWLVKGPEKIILKAVFSGLYI